MAGSSPDENFPGHDATSNDAAADPSAEAKHPETAAVSDANRQKIRAGLERHLEKIRQEALHDKHASETTTQAIEAALARLRESKISDLHWPVLRHGMKRSYKKSRAAFQAAVAERTTANLHEWRKQAKYFWYQIEMVERIRPKTMKKIADRLHELTQFLGDDHDLAVLRENAPRPIPNGSADRKRPTRCFRCSKSAARNYSAQRSRWKTKSSPTIRANSFAASTAIGNAGSARTNIHIGRGPGWSRRVARIWSVSRSDPRHRQEPAREREILGEWHVPTASCRCRDPDVVRATPR